MPQIRLFLRAGETDANHMLDLLGQRFEDDGYPVATSEVDEKTDIWEASVYVDETEQEAALEAMATCLREAYPRADIQVEELPDIDWVSRSLEGLKPVRAGRFLVHGAHDRHAVRPGDMAIEIDAGQAFGTGHHGTTSGCLEMIEEVVRRTPPKAALDLGTGSGVLAIALAKMSPSRVLATDIDPIATDVAGHNARLNQVASRITMRTASGFHAPVFAEQGPFDVIVANILAKPLMRMAPQLVRHLAPGGQVILSGILAEQRWKVLSAYNAQHLAHRKTIWREGWVTIHLS